MHIEGGRSKDATPPAKPQNTGTSQNNKNNVIMGNGANITGNITNSFSAGKGSSVSTTTTVQAKPTSSEEAKKKIEEMQSEIAELQGKFHISATTSSAEQTETSSAEATETAEADD